MSKRILTAATVGVAGLVTLGVVSIPVGSALADRGDGDAFTKRDEQQTELALVADDNDDDPTNDRTRDRFDNTRNTRGTAADATRNTRGTHHTAVSRNTRDNTRSNVTKVSRDRDLSRGDKTRDWTRDGGDRTRDLTQNLTNDRSRNDTRR